MAITRIVERTVSLDAMAWRESLPGLAYQGEQNAHQFVIHCTQDGSPVTLTGSVLLKFLRPDGIAVDVPGSVVDGAAVVTLSGNCYEVMGRAEITIFVTQDSATVAVYSATTAVTRTTSGEEISGGDIINLPALQERFEDMADAIEDCEAATAAAEGITDMIAPVESTSTASQAYAVGDYLIYNGTLYEVTAAIASGGTLTVGTNIAASDGLGGAVTDLRNTVTNCIVSKINLEQGGFTGASGKQDNTKRIRLITPIFLPKGAQINLFIGDLCWLAWELSSSVTTGGNVIVSTGWNTGIEYTTRNDCWLMMAFATALSESSSSAISVNDFSEKSINIVVPNNDVNEMKTYIDCGGAQITSSDFEQGEFTSANGKISGTKRIRLRYAIECKKLSEIKFPDNNLYYSIWFLSSDNLSTPSVIAMRDWAAYTELQVPADCYVYIAAANALTYASSTDIVPSDFDGTISFAENNYYLGKINDNAARIDRIINNRQLLYISDVKQGGFSATDYTSSNQRICTTDCVALPYGEKTKLTVKMAPAILGDYFFAVRAGRTAQDLSSNKYWYKSGDTVTFTNHEQYYRVIFANGYSSNGYYYYYDITPSDIATIQPVVEYSYMDDGDVMDTLTSNADNLQRLINSRNVLSASSHGGTTLRPVIFHVSDLHGDRERAKNALDICKHCDGDAIIFSGDIVSNRPIDGVGWMHKLFAGFGGTPILCVGNHEVTQEGITDEQVYEYFMQPSATKIGNANAKTYYYTDITSKQIRIISVDLYQYGATTRSNTHMTSEQLAYICSALKTTPTGYGVLIVAHTPCVDVGSRIDQNYPTFFQPLRKYGFTHYDIVGAPIYDIIDAFNSRTTISKTYAQTGSPSSISVSDDFSSVDASVEFIAHITGHIHEDSVCYLPTQTKQLMLNITCGCAMSGGSSYPYLADDCDITRIPYDKTQDAINAYVIDRVGKRVRIVRIGGTLTYDMQNREYMEIPYAD